MNKLILTVSLVVVAVAAILSGCATTQGTQEAVPTDAVQSNTGPTVSGYISVGGAKKF
jgi:uncharacterized lipoprotein YajG